MKWGTLLLIIIAIVSVVGIAIFMVPWEDVGTSFHCGDTSYAFEQHVNVRAWYDPSETYMQRRIVHEPGDEAGLDWIFLDHTFVDPRNPDAGRYQLYTHTPKELRSMVEGDYNAGYIPYEAWHWFDCTICATQGEC